MDFFGVNPFITNAMALPISYWGNHFLARGYCVDTVGLDAEMVKKSLVSGKILAFEVSGVYGASRKTLHDFVSNFWRNEIRKSQSFS